MKRPTPEEIRAALDREPAPEPPDGLMETVKRSIPEPLPRWEAPAPWGRADWFRLAATLVLVAGGVLLGYKIALWMRTPAETGTVARLVPRASGPLTLQTTELPIQAVPASYVSTKESPRSTIGAMPEPFRVEEARRYLERGELPPSDAVPPLSWAGYFDPAEAPAGEGDELELEGGPSPLNPDPSFRLLRVSVEAPRAPLPPRPPVDLTVMVDLQEADERLEEVERSLREAAAGLQANDRLRMVFEQELGREEAPPPGVRLKERQEFVFIGEPTAPGSAARKPTRRVIRITRGGGPFAWSGDEEGAGKGREVEVRTIVVQAPDAPDAPVPPLPLSAPSAPLPPRAPAPPATVSVPPAELSATLRQTVRALAGGREVTVEFNPHAVEYYRLVGQGRPAPSDRSGPDRMVALYEIKLAPGAAVDAVVAALRLNDGGGAAVLSLELKRAEFAASMEQASAGLRAGALSAQVTAALEQERSLQRAEARRLAGEARRLAGEKILLEQQARELQRLAEIAAGRLSQPQP